MNWGKWIQQALVYLDSHCEVNALPEWVLTLTVEKNMYFIFHLGYLFKKIPVITSFIFSFGWLGPYHHLFQKENTSEEYSESFLFYC